MIKRIQKIIQNKNIITFNQTKNFSIKLNYFNSHLNDITILHSKFIYLPTSILENDFLKLDKEILNNEMQSKFQNIIDIKKKNEVELLNNIKTYFSLANLEKNAYNPIILQKYNNLNEIISEFKKIKFNIKELIKKVELLIREQKNSAYIDKITDIIVIIKIFNILDLEIWQKIIRLSFTNLSYFTTSTKILKIFNSINELFKLFYSGIPFTNRQTDEKNPFFFYFPENELKNLLNKNIFQILNKQFMLWHENNLKNEIYLIQNEMNNWVDLIMQMSQFSLKFSRVSHMDFLTQKEGFAQYIKFIETNFSLIKEEKTILLFKEVSNYIYGVKNDLQNTIESNIINKMNYFRCNIDSGLVNSLIIAWKNLGNYNEIIYKELIENNLLNSITNMSKSNLIRLCYDLYCANILDTNLWNNLTKKISQYKSTQLDLYQKKSLHITFTSIFINSEKITEIIIKNCANLINDLALICIHSNKNQNLDLISKTKFINHDSILDCTYIKDIQKIRNTEKNIKKYDNFDSQENQIADAEKFVYNSLKNYFSNKNVEVIRNYQICVYKIDIALFFKDTDEKIVIEISGAAYLFENGDKLGKKKIKFNILKKLGWKIAILDMRKREIFDIFSTFNKKSEKNIMDSINNILKKQL